MTSERRAYRVLLLAHFSLPESFYRFLGPMRITRISNLRPRRRVAKRRWKKRVYNVALRALSTLDASRRNNALKVARVYVK